MATTVDSRLMADMQKLGAFDVSACYNCGTCTAICPLSEEGHEFPRKLIRYATLGLKDMLLASPEVWMCYFCGECTTSCPRSADPGQFMMSARRYVTRKYSWGGIADAFYGFKYISVLALALLSVVLLGTFLAYHGPIVTSSVDMWTFLPIDLIDKGGLVLGAFVGLSLLANLALMYRGLSRVSSGTSAGAPKKPLGKRVGIWIRTLVSTVILEALLQGRYLKCARSPTTDGSNRTYRYWAHMALFWGFVGLALATMTDYGIDSYGIGIPRTAVRIWGSAAGVALMLGAGYFIYKRLKKDEVYSKYNHFSDWVLLVLLFLAGLTGFLIDVFYYAGLAEATYSVLIIHIVLAFDLLVTLPFTKFAHALYRPFALWLIKARGQIASLPE